MSTLTELLESFPQELRVPMARLVDALKEELQVTKADFIELRAVVQELAEAQRRTELQVQELAEAQRRTEQGLEDLRGVVRELAEAQRRTELQVQELAEAQRRTERDLGDLRGVVQELAQAHRGTEQALRELAETQTKFSRTFYAQMGALGARWGLQAEGAFREGMRAILQEVGFSTERFSVKDTTGEALGYPEQIELDILIKNGKLLVAEIKSSIDREHTVGFNKKVAFYTRKTGRQVDRKLIIAPHVEAGTQELARELGVEIYTDINELS